MVDNSANMVDIGLVQQTQPRDVPRFCRVCGLKKKGRPLAACHIKYIKLFFPELHLLPGSYSLCSRCEYTIERGFKVTSGARRRKGHFTMIIWNTEIDSPEIDPISGKPLRPSLGSNRSVDGRFRSKTSFLSPATNEVRHQDQQPSEEPSCSQPPVLLPQLRRSSRRTQSQILEVTQKNLEAEICSKSLYDGLMVKDFGFPKGRGVVSDKAFRKNELVSEYIGELISRNEAVKREKNYKKDPSILSYIYFFKHCDIPMAIDATEESANYGPGRLINHTRKGNLFPNLTIKNEIRLFFFAKRDIQKGEEMLYDYGDKNRTNIENNPWLAF